MRVIEKPAGASSPLANYEAEQAMLGAIFANNRVFDLVNKFLRPEHFADPLHGRIYEAAGTLIRRGQIANFLTLRNMFDQDPALAEAGGGKYLARHQNSLVTIMNAADYGRTVHDLAERRRIIALCEQAIDDARCVDVDRPAAAIAAGLLAGVQAGISPPQIGGVNLGMEIFRHIDDIALTDRLVKGLIGEESLAIVAGPAGSGKTFCALHLAICVAIAREFFGQKTMKCGVLYVGAEGQAGLKKRIKAWKLHHVIGDEDVPFALYPAPIDLVTDPKGAEAVIERVELLRNMWDIDIWLVVIDTLARCFGSGDESATQDMNTFITRCDSIRNRCKAAVLIVHHFGKDESKGMRGSVALKAAADTVIEVTGTLGTRTARVEKQKDGATGEQFAFSLKVVELGIDEDGEPITSCVVEPEDVGNTAKRQIVTGQAKIALNLLEKALAADGQPAPVGRHFPGGQTAVELARDFRTVLNGFIIREEVSDGKAAEVQQRVQD